MDGIQAQGMRVKLYRYTSEQKAAIMSDVLTAKAILVGSPTQNCVMMPTMGAFMMYLKGMKLTDKKAAAFGTYGWAGGAEKELEDAITASGDGASAWLYLQVAPPAGRNQGC